VTREADPPREPGRIRRWLGRSWRHEAEFWSRRSRPPSPSPKPPRVLTEEEWDKGPDNPVPAPPPVKPRRPYALDRDPEGTVARARGVYLRMLGKDPEDASGAVARAREIALVVAREAERRRLERDTAATRKRWEAIAAAKHGRLYDVAKSVWYGIPFTGAPELLYPELSEEDALTKGEWFEWAQGHRQAGADAMIDHLASIIPPGEGESFDDWRERLKARRRYWAEETDEVAVNKPLFPRARGESYSAWIHRIRGGGRPVSQSPSARPRPAGPQSPARSRTGVGPRARRPHPR